jgi:hypothetical protein
MSLALDSLKQIWTALTFAEQLSANKSLNSDLRPAIAAVLDAIVVKAEEDELARTAPPPPTLESFGELKPLGFRHPEATGSFSAEPWVFKDAIALYSAQQLLDAGWQLGRAGMLVDNKAGLLTPQEVWDAVGGSSDRVPNKSELLAALRQRSKPRLSASSEDASTPRTKATEAPQDSTPSKKLAPETPTSALMRVTNPPKNVPTLTVQTAEVTDDMVERFNSEIEVQRSGAIHGLDLGLRAMLRGSTTPIVQSLADYHFGEPWLAAFHGQVQVQRNGSILGLKEGLLAFIHEGFKVRNRNK